jgi:hydroxyacylglutathione hydrolase
MSFHIERYYLQCLSHASYVVWDDLSKECAIIDPQRDIGQYQEFIAKQGLTVKYILETHVHADFVSGHLELANLYHAPIVYGKAATTDFEVLACGDGCELPLGASSITILETPGHTPESVCFWLKSGEEQALFSGDTLFVGDVGRPDLLGSAMPAEILAKQLFHTVQRLKTLPDALKVYPAHGSGSSCGKSLGDSPFTTIGQEKITNYAFKIPELEEFILAVTADQPEAPKYFSTDAKLNKSTLHTLADLLKNYTAFTSEQVQDKMYRGAVVLDTRQSDFYMHEHIPHSLHIGLDGQFAHWVGSLIPHDAEIIIIADSNREQEALIRCARVGVDSVVGFLHGGLSAWKKAGYAVKSAKRYQPNRVLGKSDVLLLDVRKESERSVGFIEGSHAITLSQLSTKMGEVPSKQKIITYCAGGYRSAMAVSILERAGKEVIGDIAGGYQLFNQFYKGELDA